MKYQSKILLQEAETVLNLSPKVRQYFLFFSFFIEYLLFCKDIVSKRRNLNYLHLKVKLSTFEGVNFEAVFWSTFIANAEKLYFSIAEKLHVVLSQDLGPKSGSEWT